MRTLLCAIPALLALAGTASAEPQQLDEAQLGDVAAGNWALSTNQSSITSTSASTTNLVDETVNQSLGSVSTNTNYATGLNSQGVTATGSAFTSVTGNIGP